MNFGCCRCWLQQIWSVCVGASLHHSALEPIYLIFWGHLTSICPRLLNEYKTCVPVFPQKDKNTSYNHYQEHIRFWRNPAIAAFCHCVAFHMLGQNTVEVVNALVTCQMLAWFPAPWGEGNKSAWCPLFTHASSFHGNLHTTPLH